MTLLLSSLPFSYNQSEFRWLQLEMVHLCQKFGLLYQRTRRKNLNPKNQNLRRVKGLSASQLIQGKGGSSGSSTSANSMKSVPHFDVENGVSDCCLILNVSLPDCVALIWWL